MLKYYQRLLTKNLSREILKTLFFYISLFSPQKQEVFSDIYLPNQSRVSKRLHLSLQNKHFDPPYPNHEKRQRIQFGDTLSFLFNVSTLELFFQHTNLFLIN